MFIGGNNQISRGSVNVYPLGDHWTYIPRDTHLDQGIIWLFSEIPLPKLTQSARLPCPSASARLPLPEPISPLPDCPCPSPSALCPIALARRPRARARVWSSRTVKVTSLSEGWRKILRKLLKWKSGVGDDALIPSPVSASLQPSVRPEGTAGCLRAFSRSPPSSRDQGGDPLTKTGIPYSYYCFLGLTSIPCWLQTRGKNKVYFAIWKNSVQKHM